jgi:translation initiation factor 4G
LNVEIRPARSEDAEFLAWLMLTAGRAHVTRGIWEVIIGGTEQDSLEFLRLLAVTTTPHLFHYSCYLLAEADGKPAAGLGGYDPNICGYEALYRAMPEVLKKLGHSGPDPEANRRAERVLCCIPGDAFLKKVAKKDFKRLR